MDNNIIFIRNSQLLKYKNYLFVISRKLLIKDIIKPGKTKVQAIIGKPKPGCQKKVHRIMEIVNHALKIIPLGLK